MENNALQDVTSPHDTDSKSVMPARLGTVTLSSSLIVSDPSTLIV